MEHIDYMKEANKEALINSENNFLDGGHFGAVIVKDGEIIGKGRNTVLKDKNPISHAEMNAISDACKKIGTHDLSGAVMYTSCYPCPMCLSAAVWANIKEIYYGNTSMDAELIGLRDDNIYKLIKDLEKGIVNYNLTIKKIGREVTLESFKKFKECKDKKIY